MANQDYGELFCQAIDEIVKKRLEGISYDSTILCTIVDDSKRDKGIYTVSNGSAKFEATSAVTSYRNNTNVYVQIPGGDMNEQKIIIAKKTDSNDTPYVYQRPFSTLVDITGNLISSNIESSETGLRANAYTEGFPDSYGDRQQAITLWTYNAYDEQALRNEEGSAHSAFTRLGIQGSFQSWLNPFYADLENEAAASQPRYVIKGDYGLRLRVYTTDETVSTDTEGKASYYDMYLNCADMNGNPYNFQTFYQQEKVFDISAIGSIQKMELQFYQTPGSFVDIDGEKIPFTDFLGNYIAPNIYLKDPYITLGYDISEFDEEMVQIYTFDSTTFNATAQPLTNNHKQIHLRWIHKLDDGTFMSVDDKTKFDYEVRWYRYELGHSSADEYSGVYWKNLSKQTSVDAEHTYEILDQQWLIENTKNGQEYQREPGFFSSWLLPDITLQNEQVKAIIIYNGKPYRSNILKCENEREVVNKATVDAVQALSINCADNTYGNYRIYNQGNSLIDYAQAQVVREWIPYFSSATGTGENIPRELDEAESIEWIIPTEKTMIIIDDGFKGGDCEISEDTDKRLHIKRYGSGVASNELAGRNTQQYRIRSYYSQTYSDNTIQCKIIKNNTTYTATKELTFGVAGTTGTDCTFILDFDNGVTAITNDSSSAVTVTARLYDYENNEVSLEGRDITWKFKDDGDGLLTISSLTEPYRREIKRNTAKTWSSANYNILQASMVWGDTTLYAYLPIPIRSSNEYAYISGTTQVIYNSAGEILDYFKNPYAIYDTNANEVNPGTISWTVINNNTQEDGVYSPKINSGKDGLEYLTPLSFYVEGACKKVCVVAKIGSTTIWSQPLLIMQNKYPSAMINKWDGSLDVGTTDPGTILAPRLVAGMKHDEDNTFSGVMLGNWGDTESENSLTSGDTGLYGFDHGEQSYAFKQDGSAFIGKSGAARIVFNDQEPGAIYSNAWTEGSTGMKINLAAGTIDAHTFTLTAGKNNTTPTGGSDNTILIDTTAPEYPLRIGLNFDVDWSGNLKATNAVFDGDGEFHGTIYATGGELGDLSVTGTLTGGTISGSYIRAPSTGTATFEVTAGGVLTATGATITGTINASGGTITGDMVVSGTLSGGTIDGATITSGSLNIGSGNFVVNSNGVMTAKGGQIGAWKFGISTGDSGSVATNWNALYASYTIDNVTKYTVLDPGRSNVITVGTSSAPNQTDSNFNDGAFRVLQDGTMYATNGKIGGWTLSSDGLSASGIKISPTGGITGGITIDSAKITNGSISSATISSCNITSGMKLNGSDVSATTITYVQSIDSLDLGQFGHALLQDVQGIYARDDTLGQYCYQIQQRKRTMNFANTITIKYTKASITTLSTTATTSSGSSAGEFSASVGKLGNWENV